jgi:hypothetical protein
MDGTGIEFPTVNAERSGRLYAGPRSIMGVSCWSSDGGILESTLSKSATERVATCYGVMRSSCGTQLTIDGVTLCHQDLVRGVTFQTLVFESSRCWKLISSAQKSQLFAAIYSDFDPSSTPAF